MFRIPPGLPIFVGLFFLAAVGLRAASPLPPKPAQYATDSAGLLTVDTVKALNDKLAAYERETSNQILVYVMPDVPEGYALEDFTQRASEAWGVGQKGKNNGVVVFVFAGPKKLRIEVGYGLEGVLTDALSARIIANEIRPAFRDGYYNSGVQKGVEAIMSATHGEYKATRPPEDESADNWIPVAMMGFFFVIFFFSVLMPYTRGAYYGPRGRKRDWWLTSGSGGFLGGGSGSSSSGGGGFSGGGGSFGGGGASGGW